MSEFNFGKYDYSDTSLIEKSNDNFKSNDKSFNFDKYDNNPSEIENKSNLENDKVYQQIKAPEITREEFRNMTIKQKQEHSKELLREREFGKQGLVKGAINTARNYLLPEGFNKVLNESELLKEKEYESGSKLGEMLVEALPMTAAFKAIQGLAHLPKLGKFATGALEVLGVGGLFGAKETHRQMTHDEELNLKDIAIQASLGAAGDLLFKGGSKAYSWLKSLKPKQQSEILMKGILPKDLSENSLKMWEEQVIPELKSAVEQEYKIATEAATAEAELKYANDMKQIRGKHENDLYHAEKKLQEEMVSYEKDKLKFENDKKNIIAQHEQDMYFAEKQYQEDLKNYNTKKQSFENERQKVRSVHENELYNSEKTYEENLKEYEIKKKSFENERSDVRKSHEHDLYQAERDFTKATYKYENSKTRYENKVKETIEKNEKDFLHNESKFNNEKKEYELKKQKYQQEVEETKFNHELEVEQIKKENDNSLNKYIEELEDYEFKKERTDKINQVFKRREEAKTSLDNRVKQNGKDIGLRPAESNSVNEDVSNKVGNLFSKNKIDNKENVTKSVMKVTQDLDNEAYKKVNEAYKLSREANEGINATHPFLVRKLEDMLLNLNRLSSPSGPQKELIKTIKDLILGYTKGSEKNLITGKQEVVYKTLSNQKLIDDMQAIRFKVDYDFAHGETNNIFKPVISALEGAIESTAKDLGHETAVKEFRNAKTLYKDWTNKFNNKNIRVLRNRSNEDYLKTFDKIESIDSFKQVEKILNNSPEGQVLSRALKRDIIDKRLSKYYENPRKINYKELESDLKELRSIITPEQEHQIRKELSASYKSPNFQGKKLEKPVEPKEPKLKIEPEEPKVKEFKVKEPEKKQIENVKIPEFTKEVPEKKIPQVVRNPIFKEKIPEKKIPEKVKNPIFKEKVPEKKIPEKVKIPHFNKEKPTQKIMEPVKLPKFEIKENADMKEAAHFMNMKPEETRKLVDSVSGLRKLKSKLDRTPKGKEIYEKITKDKVKNIFFEGRAQREFTGGELYDIVNKRQNYEVLSEILGENETKDLLEATKQIGEKRATLDMMKNYSKKVATLKYLSLLGVI